MSALFSILDHELKLFTIHWFYAVVFKFPNNLIYILGRLILSMQTAQSPSYLPRLHPLPQKGCHCPTAESDHSMNHKAKSRPLSPFPSCRRTSCKPYSLFLVFDYRNSINCLGDSTIQLEELSFKAAGGPELG